MPTIAQLFLAELDREMPITRRVLSRVPEGRNEWKPHARSMPLGYLAALVAVMPSWIVSMVQQPELDLGSGGESTFAFNTTQELLAAFDAAAAQARAVLEGVTDDQLMTEWQLRVRGEVVYREPRHIAVRDSCINHLAHHRGQLTVYLRLNEVPVPSVYGPTADERIF